jgi:hypothetical protein
LFYHFILACCVNNLIRDISKCLAEDSTEEEGGRIEITAREVTTEGGMKTPMARRDKTDRGEEVAEAAEEAEEVILQD